ncbi:hypothetical protein BOX15_Mlig018240g3, partial [Macrostomum lignano]
CQINQSIRNKSMAEWRGNFGIDSDEEANIDEAGRGDDGPGSRSQPSRDGLIVLIDCRDSMRQQTNSANQTLIKMSFKCAKTVLKRKALASDRDLLAVVLFGCGKCSNPDMRHVLTLQPLEQPGADRIKQLGRLAELDAAALETEIGRSAPEVSISDAIWTCQSIFSACTVRLGYRRIFMLTNDDNPHDGDQHKRAQLRTKILDLQQTEIELLIIPLLPTASGANLFDCRRFYFDNLLPENERPEQGSDLLAELLQNVDSKAAIRRAQVRLSIRLGPGMSLPVSVYNLTRRCTVPTAERLHRATNERVKRTTRKFLTDTAEVLMPTDLKKAAVVNGKKVLFEQEEVKQMRRLAETGLSLIAFYPMSAMKSHYHIGPASFIYPDEVAAQGSVCLFTGLLKACLDKNRFALCSYTPRSNAVTSLVALLPQAEVRDPDTGAQSVPPGFHLVHLPFADDFRKLTFDQEADELRKCQAAEEELKLAGALIERTVADKWSPEMHCNPALQAYQSQLEAIALDKAEPRQFTDTTRMSERDIAHSAKAVDRFLKAFDIRKRSEGGVGNAAAKRARVIDAANDIEAEARAGQLAKLTVPVLKEAANGLRLKPASQRKQDLINAINAHFGL